MANIITKTMPALRHPHPLKHVRYPLVTRPKEKRMTVCIAAACENGEFIVSATDGLLSGYNTSGECVLAKMLWFGPWQFMYAGTPAYFSIMAEEIEKAAARDVAVLSRANIIDTTQTAYRKVHSIYSATEILSSFGMTLEEFRETGLKTFGRVYHAELAREIINRGSQFSDQILLTGWGVSKHSAMIVDVASHGHGMHEASGFAAIGSGGPMAMMMLLLLNQGRHRTLAETLFNVACAKFLSEGSEGVGKATAIYVSWKNDEIESKKSGAYVSDEDVDGFRVEYERHLKPRIPDDAFVFATDVSSRVRGDQKV